MDSSPLTIMVLLKTEFERQSVPYLVGGSVASSVYGIPRTTRDVDFMAALADINVAPLVAALQDDCYIDADMIQDAIETQSSFNILHLPTMHKADVFVQPSNAWASEQMARRLPQKIVVNGREEVIQFACPEHMILQKLYWFRLGGGVSQYQLPDVVGMLKVQAGQLDYAYLRHWAKELNLTDLLQHAYEDAGIDAEAL
jgi:hypothetical protein